MNLYESLSLSLFLFLFLSLYYIYLYIGPWAGRDPGLRGPGQWDPGQWDPGLGYLRGIRSGVGIRNAFTKSRFRHLCDFWLLYENM